MHAYMTRFGTALVLAAFGAAAAGAQTPAGERPAAQQPRSQSERQSSGNPVSDGWITMKIHSQFVPEDVLEGSDIDVDTNNAVVTLSGTVPTKAAKARAVAIAMATDGVKTVNDRLRIAPAAGTDVDDAARDTGAAATGAAGAAGAAAREAGRDTADTAREAGRDTAETAREAGRDTAGTAREAGRDTKEAAREAGRDARDSTRGAGDAARDAGRGTAAAAKSATRPVTDGWITSKIYAQFITEDALEDSNVDVDTRRGVVTLNGTVRTPAAKTRALEIAKATDGVKSVKDNLRVSAKSS